MKVFPRIHHQNECKRPVLVPQRRDESRKNPGASLSDSDPHLLK